MLYLKQSTASQSVVIGPFVDSTDGATAETGLTIANTDIRLSKNGANIVAKNSGGGTHDEGGFYTITLDATDTNTVGRLQLYVAVAGALTVYHEFQVLEEAVFDAMFAASAAGYSTLDAAGVRTAVGLASANLDTQLSTIDGVVDDILVDTAEIGAAGAGLTAVPWNASWDAEVQSEVQDAIEANHLDHLLAVDYDPASKPGTATALLNELVENDGGVSRFTINALENAPSGSGASAASIADAVWDEALSGHTTAGSFGKALADIEADATAILADTAEIGAAGAGLTAVPWNAAWDAEVQSECTDALNAYDPPTNAEMEARTLVAANYATASALTTVDNEIAVIDGIVDELKSGIVYGAAATGTLSTTQASTNLTGYADDQLIGRVVIWLSGNCEGEATDITDYASTGGLLTFTALTTAPGNGDTFKIV